VTPAVDLGAEPAAHLGEGTGAEAVLGEVGEADGGEGDEVLAFGCVGGLDEGGDDDGVDGAEAFAVEEEDGLADRRLGGGEVEAGGGFRIGWRFGEGEEPGGGAVFGGDEEGAGGEALAGAEEDGVGVDVNDLGVEADLSSS
jgi:hypothetical protein